MADSKARFSDRVADYVKTRPTYPPAAIDALFRLAGVPRTCTVADVGAGTGISARLLLDAGATVAAVEPNREMRAAMEQWLGDEPRFRAVDGSAEATTLAEGSVDLVVAAQAFHWFDGPGARREFGRILRGEKPVALMWNDRKTAGSAFLEGYERILMDLGTDYARVNHRNITAQSEAIRAFFGGACELFVTGNHQDLDEAGFLGRAFSSSYTPGVNDPQRPLLERALRGLFAREQRGGLVRLEYETQVFVGRLG